MIKKFEKALPALRSGLFGLVMTLALPIAAVAQGAFTLGLNGDTDVEEFTLPIGKSQIIQSSEPLSQVVVGNPEIADVELLDESQFLILGKAPGITNVAFRGTDSRIIALLDVVVGFDLKAIKQKLNEMLPEEQNIEVRSANGSVMLSGQVSSSLALDTLVAITESFAGNNVVNLMQVGGGQQVMLEVRISEVKRSRLRDLGAEMQILGHAGSETTLDLFTGGPLQGAFGDGFVLNNTSIADNLLLNLRALEREGSAHVLAEPNIVALSGQEASFLVGGEFPVPVAQAGAVAGGITVEYKEFGVGLRFTPTVLSSKRISITLNTEVSDVDASSGTSVLGTTVPGLRTTRAATTIELGDGNSFAIAGLLQNDIASVVNRFPGLGSVPILGALFRSTEFEREETELVIVVTPRLVKSTNSGAIALPTDGYRPPNRWDQYGLGLTEAAEPDDQSGGNGAQGPAAEEGLDGAQGHQF